MTKSLRFVPVIALALLTGVAVLPQQQAIADGLALPGTAATHCATATPRGPMGY